MFLTFKITYHLLLIIYHLDKMLTIGLMRMGAKKKPFYRIVVREKRAKRDGKYVENIGTYNPMQNPAEVKLKLDRADYWIQSGAQPTETVRSLINKERQKPLATETASV
jgi:small subunit ribosomal protein S16